MFYIESDTHRDTELHCDVVTGVAPHCPFGPIALAASLHLDAAIPNFLIQEQTAMGDGMLVTPFREIFSFVVACIERHSCIDFGH